jgi:hypothetical protein
VDFGATRIGSDMNAYAEGKIEEVAIWNRLLSESEVKELYRKGATRLDLNLYTCSDSACANKTSSLYVSDLNNKSVVDISSLPDSKYLGFDVLFRQNPLMIDENHTLNRFVYPSYIRDINISYVG